MSKLLRIVIFILFATEFAAAQQPYVSERAIVQELMTDALKGNPMEQSSAKQTGMGDTVYITHINTSAGADTIVRYYFAGDTGEVFGTNAFELKGFSERYDVLASTATYKVIGVRAKFGGTVMPGSTRAVEFHVWSQGTKSGAGRPTLFYNGLPQTILASETVPVTQLGVASSPTEGDTTKNHFFASPTSFLLDSFFIGYTIDYTWATLGGDTIGLYSNQDGERTEPAYFVVSSSDTTINVVNATMTHGGEWFDNGTTGYGPYANLCIYPIVIIGPGTTTGLPGISQGGFTFRGATPNPASTATTVRFALAAKADVTIEVTDMAGRGVSVTKKSNLAAGEHGVEINTASFAPGAYVCTIYTSAGDGIATQLVISK